MALVHSAVKGSPCDKLAFQSDGIVACFPCQWGVIIQKLKQGKKQFDDKWCVAISDTLVNHMITYTSTQVSNHLLLNPWYSYEIIHPLISLDWSIAYILSYAHLVHWEFALVPPSLPTVPAYSYIMQMRDNYVRLLLQHICACPSIILLTLNTSYRTSSLSQIFPMLKKAFFSVLFLFYKLLVVLISGNDM